MILRDINFKTNCVEELNERRQAYKGLFMCEYYEKR